LTLAHPEMDSVIEIGTEHISTLVIENRGFFRSLLHDISGQCGGESGRAVLTEGIKQLDFSKHVEVIDSFLSFTLNRKNLLSKINAAFEKAAVQGDNYLQTAELLSAVERYMNTLAEGFSGNITCGKMTAANLVKMAALTVVEDYENPLEQILDYMELVREFDRDRLFLFVNMRGYFEDEAMAEFCAGAIAHEYKILLVDAFAAAYLPGEKRLTIDEDLCEF